MANQPTHHQNASPKQTRNLNLTESKAAPKQPPIKKLPPPDDDVLVFLPIG